MITKQNLFIALSFCLLLACEKDDFCTFNPVTPKLILRFYDDTNPQSIKSVQRFSAIALSKTDSLLRNQSFDSIALPLNSAASSTTYVLKVNNNSGAIQDNEVSTITISYTPVDIYVSRSCGFRVDFQNLSINYNGTWIKNIIPITTASLEDQSKAHVQVFH